VLSLGHGYLLKEELYHSEITLFAGPKNREYYTAHSRPAAGSIERELLSGKSAQITNENEQELSNL
jgi:hypothetical protein